MVTQRLDFFSGKGRRSQEKVSILLESKLFQTHFVFQSNPGTFWGIAIDPELQDKKLLPKGFTEYIYHVGNVSEVHPRIRSG